MSELSLLVVLSPLVIGAYAYIGYPFVLWVIARLRTAPRTTLVGWPWPTVTITVPVFNSVSSIGATLEQLLSVDYPRDRLQILVLSDASTDGTDDVVRGFAERGVELLRADDRRGKTAGENAAVAFARGEIIVNVDATVRVPADSLKRLVAAFSDPSVGVASGRDISVDATELSGSSQPTSAAIATGGEAGYVGYEMWVRDLETRVGSIVGASGCFFAIRRQVHKDPLPPALSWDFASTLVARKLGYRSVSVRDAVCVVPRTSQIRTELTRKSRTMARGLSTLFHFRELMNPVQYGSFALMLISHKLLRWLPYLLAPFAILALGYLATGDKVAAFALAVATLGALSGVASISRPTPWKPFAWAGFAVAALTAGFLAWYSALRGTQLVTWNPTPRPTASTV
jgi:cellulose synthase/poly-beta-1,6-N-acetylglucosamine synthase-like glycosyltransferase